MYKRSAKQQKALRAYHRERLKRWNSANKCSNCGGKRDIRGKKRCSSCIRRLQAWYRRNQDRINEERRKYFRALKAEIFEAYGGPVCRCCGESHLEFLTIDHVNGGGSKHRKKVGSGNAFYLWLRKRKFPPGFQILCMNCNLAKGIYGECPHETEKTMLKYSVEEEPAAVKTADNKTRGECPKCNVPLVAPETTNVLMCPKCGTKAFEVPQ